jgi:hypothetical protein
MALQCDGCGNESAYATKTSFSKEGRFETCDKCGDAGRSGSPDVFFNRPYVDEDIVDENKPETWQGTFIRSKRHLASEMKRLGLVETHDPIHGARPRPTLRRSYI